MPKSGLSGSRHFWPELYMEAQMQKLLLEMTSACLKTYETIYNMIFGKI